MLCGLTMSQCISNVYLQAFIHPGLAYFFWSTHKVTDLSSLFSPYQSCNGTLTSTINHEMTYKSGRVSFAFYDLAGCGLVHVCGEYCMHFTSYKINNGVDVFHRRYCSICS